MVCQIIEEFEDIFVWDVYLHDTCNRVLKQCYFSDVNSLKTLLNYLISFDLMQINSIDYLTI